jgi:hypothetical protein
LRNYLHDNIFLIPGFIKLLIFKKIFFLNLFLIQNKTAAVAVKKILLLLVTFFIAQVLLAQGISYVQVCPKGNTTLNADNTSATNNYQWQINTGTGFTDLSDDANYSGSGGFSMQMLNLPTAWYGYQYRCVTDGIAGSIYSLQFVTTWTDFTDNWSDVRNWSCGVLPDSTTDVVIPYGGEVIIDINAICRSLSLNPNSSVIVDPGVNLIIAH